MLKTAILSLLTTSSTGNNGQTRAVEYMLAWLMIGWGSMLAWYPGDILVGLTYRFVVAFATEHTWAIVSLTAGTLRIIALIINGAWRRTPLVRFCAAAFGLLWWTTLGGLYWLAVLKGGAPFPNILSYAVFVYFEAYSCYRCGQDAADQCSFGNSRTPRSGRGTNG